MVKVLAVTCMLLAVAVVASPQRAEAAPSDGEVSFSAPLTNVFITSPGSQPYNFDVDIKNNTSETVRLVSRVISGLKDWNARLFDRFKTVKVQGLQLVPEEDITLDFNFTVPETAEEGEYEFKLVLEDVGGERLGTIDFVVGIDRKKSTAEEILDMSARYTSLTGPSGSTFEFRVDMTNRSDTQRSFDLGADAPPGWQVSFKPTFEDSRITSLSMNAGQTSSLDIEVQPPLRAQPGSYDIFLVATSDDFQAVAPLEVELTGRPDVVIGTRDDLLNVEATAGQGTSVSMKVIGIGTAAVRNINFLTDAPAGWQVTVDSEGIPQLEPGEIEEVTVSITPPNKTIPGDYRVSIFASSTEAEDDVDLRVTVLRSTIWGGVAIAIIILVIIGMGALFLRLGRR